MSKLLVYIRFSGSTSTLEEMLYRKLLQKIIEAKDVLEAVSSYFDHDLIKWENLVDVCPNGAPEMLGSRSGFVSRIKQRSPNQ